MPETEPQESTQLIPLGELGVQTGEELAGELDVLTKTSDFLPQVRIYGSENNLVKEGKFPLGTFGLYHSSDNVSEMGPEFAAIVIAARPRASIIDDTPISSYDFKCETFQTIKTKALSKVKGHLVGLEYLLWLPTFEKFALFFFGTITLRRESPNVKALIGKGLTSKIKLIKGAKFTWHGCECFPCTAPFDLPDKADMAAEVLKFQNPAEADVEVVNEDAGSGRKR